ncbi:MAG: DUF2298 domain-containing protein, partial [Bacteriovoracaceae bacterium]|nr:DUF2298 domain-containing protein [Bacteriovoracaceae bacterium]
PHILRVEFLFLFFFCLYLCLYSLHPELFWGEKPMDFTLFNFSMRNQGLPIIDPWFAGEPMKYYYWGYTFFSGMAKMTGAKGEVGYALSLATLPALMGTALYSLFLYLCKKRWLAFGGALFLPLASNYKAFSSIVFGEAKFDIYYFWANTRVFKNMAFAEYPSWSFLFGDLHPHVMSYPFVILLLTCLVYGLHEVWPRFNIREHKLFFLLHALAYGALIGINGWDFIIYSIFNALFFLLTFKNLKRLKIWGLFLLVHLVGVALFFPMLMTLVGGVETKWGPWMSESNTLWSHFEHSGLWWLISFVMIFPVYFLHRFKLRWPVLLSSFGFRFFACSLIMALLAEFFVFSDRVNTIFKVFNNVYIWGGITTIICLRYFKYYLRRNSLIPFALGAVILINASLLGTLFNMKAISSNRPFGSRTFSLKGSSYILKTSPGDFAVIQWIRENVEGTPVLVERYSRSFDHKATRISMHTGVPTYLGWDNHVHLRGRSWIEINQRKRDIDFIFNSSDPLKVHEMMREKNLSFLVVGNLERKYYSLKGLEKFKQYSDIFKPLVVNGATTLYGIGPYEDYLVKR